MSQDLKKEPKTKTKGQLGMAQKVGGKNERKNLIDNSQKKTGRVREVNRDGEERETDTGCRGIAMEYRRGPPMSNHTLKFNQGSEVQRWN